MREPDDRSKLRRMADQCALVVADLADFTYDRFLSEKVLYDATVMRLLTIGEDANNLTEATRELAPTVPWHQIRGMRNVIAHDYFELRPDEIWRTAIEVLPVFRSELIRLVELVPERRSKPGS